MTVFYAFFFYPLFKQTAIFSYEVMAIPPNLLILVFGYSPFNVFFCLVEILFCVLDDGLHLRFVPGPASGMIEDAR